ncbi:glycoside hydrolase family 30 protein [Geothrix sp. PMB-07]|uniref:glycoside hydrolase family 30 protein n=1 Tax=Geothrix sp. PMB-07 TaxID=3068640 RepID=UPI002740FCF5|nr:glycoside hydrolase family 30 protein [Geothrix sp. PMB-07]WLT32365.1 glycoside hydrolase family 30 protein [Geothrix sp. PMB-07]
MRRALLCLLLAAGVCRAQVAVYRTAKGSPDRLARKADLAFTRLDQPNDEALATVVVDPAKRFQTVVGFGGALTDAAAETWAKLPAARQAELIKAYFDPQEGLGYSLGRLSIHSCDFSSGSFTYDAGPSDPGLQRFSIEHDRRFRLPFVKAALKASGGMRLFASPWSPPAWMKTNGNMLRGGKLKPEAAATWALYYARFIQAYAKEGLPIWGLTVQNEPMATQSWESCVYTAEEERDFVKQHLGPTLAQEGLGAVKLMVWDHNRGLLYQRAQAVYDDPEASKFVWGAAFHWYVGDHFEAVRQVKEAWPDKQLLFSEGCAEAFDAARLEDWNWGEKYGRSLVADLANGAAGWVDWNVLLDERGGPNHVGNFCYAPVHADTATGTLRYMNSFYYLGHVSKFVRPGAVRVAASSTHDSLQTVAFRNPDGRLAVIVLNLTDQPLPFQLWMAGRAAKGDSPAHSIQTLVF